MVIELTPEQSAALATNGKSARVINPMSGEEYVLLSIEDIQSYIQYLDSSDPEQIAWHRLGSETLGKRLVDDE